MPGGGCPVRACRVTGESEIEMIIRCVTLKTRLYGYIVDRTTDDGGYGRVRDWVELIDPEDGHIVNAFRSRKEAKEWAKAHPCY